MIESSIPKKHKAQIIGCSRNLILEVNCWYKDKIGDVIEVYEKQKTESIMFCELGVSSESKRMIIGKINKKDLRIL